MEQKPSVKSTVGCDLLKRNETEGSCISVQATLEIEDVCEVQTVWIIKFRTMCVCVCGSVGKGFRLYRLFSHVQLTGFGVFFVHPPPVPVCLQATLWWSVAKRLDCERASTPYGQCEMAATHRPHGDEDTRWGGQPSIRTTGRGVDGPRHVRMCARGSAAFRFRVHPPQNQVSLWDSWRALDLTILF